MNVKVRLQTYVAPEYRDDRKTIRSSRSENKSDLHFQREGRSRERNATASVNSQSDLTKRKIRRGHFQTDDVDS